MNVVDLFTGAGGGIIASQMLGHRTVCAVEIDPFCRRVLVHRQNDGLLPPFPIWYDVRTFDGIPWRGIADIVSGGFPCQDISTANSKGSGITGTRSGLWFEMLRIIREIRPDFVFVENSPALVSRGLDTVLGGLAEKGYDAQWMVLGADDVGANHIRKRMWILGHAPHADRMRKQQSKRDVENERGRTRDLCTEISDPSGVGRNASGHTERTKEIKSIDCSAHQHVSDSVGKRRNSRRNCYGKHDGNIVGTVRENAAHVSDTDRAGCEEQRLEVARETKFVAAEHRDWWEVEPGIRRVVDGLAHRVDRIKALGNGQVPLCAAVAWKILYERINEK